MIIACYSAGLLALVPRWHMVGKLPRLDLQLSLLLALLQFQDFLREPFFGTDVVSLAFAHVVYLIG